MSGEKSATAGSDIEGVVVGGAILAGGAAVIGAPFAKPSEKHKIQYNIKPFRHGLV